MNSRDLLKQLEKGPVHIVDKATGEIFQVDGIFTTPTIHPHSLKDGRRMLFAEGGLIWAGFEIIETPKGVN